MRACLRAQNHGCRSSVRHSGDDKWRHHYARLDLQGQAAHTDVPGSWPPTGVTVSTFERPYSCVYALHILYVLLTACVGPLLPQRRWYPAQAAECPTCRLAGALGARATPLCHLHSGLARVRVDAGSMPLRNLVSPTTRASTSVVAPIRRGIRRRLITC